MAAPLRRRKRFRLFRGSEAMIDNPRSPALGRYAAYGWTGIVPDACRDTLIIVPSNYASFLWGWPHRFAARMQGPAAKSSCLPLQRRRFHLRHRQHHDLAFVPERFSGYVWTTRAEQSLPFSESAPRSDRPGQSTVANGATFLGKGQHMFDLGFSRPPPLLLSLHSRRMITVPHQSPSPRRSRKAGEPAAELERRMTLKERLTVLPAISESRAPFRGSVPDRRPSSRAP